MANPRSNNSSVKPIKLFKNWILTITSFSSFLLIITQACGDNNGIRVIDPDSIDTTTKRGGDGKMVFLRECAACHSIFKNMTGPALDTVVRVRDSAWIFEFLTNRKLVKEDSISKSFKKDFANTECKRFPELTREQVGHVLQYIEEAQHPHY
jgi:mono/diheme cytochrome c family protein